MRGFCRVASHCKRSEQHDGFNRVRNAGLLRSALQILRQALRRHIENHQADIREMVESTTVSKNNNNKSDNRSNTTQQQQELQTQTFS